MNYKDITEPIEDIFGLLVSARTLIGLPDKIMQMVREWLACPLDANYLRGLMAAIIKSVKNGNCSAMLYKLLPGYILKAVRWFGALVLQVIKE